MKRILVVNVNWLGDVIFSSPVFKALKESYPQAKISCLAVPRVKAVLELVPFIDQVIVYDERGQHKSLLSKLKLIFELRRERFDVVFLLHRSWTRALLMFLAGIPQRIGYDEKKCGCLLTCKVETQAVSLHRSDRYLNVIESYGVQVGDRSCVLSTSSKAQKSVENFLKEAGIGSNDILVVIHFGGNWDLKRWPLRNFSLLINRLVEESSVKVVLSGSQGDRSVAEVVISDCSGGRCVNFAGKTDLHQLAALMKRAHVVVSADSGPLHLASGVGTHVVALFGPTRPEVTGPRGSGRVDVIQYDVGCNRRACYHLECPDNICMKAITVDNVMRYLNNNCENL